MSSFPLTLKNSALVGIMLVSTTLGADAYTVSRCNALMDGVYRPVLLVEVNGERSVHRIGEDGLTRSIVFNPGKALEWAGAKYGAASSWSTAATCDVTGILERSVSDDGPEDDDTRPSYLAP